MSVSLDGAQQVGSFTKVTDFRWTPDVEIETTPFLGEDSEEGTLYVRGDRFEFTLHKPNAAALSFWLALAERSRAGLNPQRVDITRVTTFPDSTQAAERVLFPECVIKQDSDEATGQKDFNAIKFSGYCRKARRI